MKGLIIGKGIAGWTLARRLLGYFDELAIVGPNEGLLEQFSGFEKGGHVYGIAAADKIERYGLKLRTHQHERRSYYMNMGTHPGYARWLDYPVQSSLPTAPKGVPTYKGQSLEDFGREAFGDEFYDSWYRPFNQRVWGVNPSMMDCDWTAGRVSLPKDSTSQWGPNNYFRWTPGDVIMDQVRFHDPKLKVINGEVRSVYPITDKRVAVEVRTSSYESISTLRTMYNVDHVFSTMPIEDLTNMVCGTTFSPRPLLRNVVTSYGLCLNKRYPFNFSWVYPDVASRVHRVTLISRYDDPNCAVDRLLLEVPSPATLKTKTFPPSHVSMLSREIINVLDALGIDESEVVRSRVCTHDGYPVPVQGHRDIVAGMKVFLRDSGIYSCGRWGSHGYYNVDHVLDDVDACVKMFELDKGKTSADDTTIEENYYTASFYYAKATQR